MALENVMRVDNGRVIDGAMPQTYPAERVMMSDGETSVEDAVDKVKNSSWVALNNNVKYRVSGGFVYIIATLSNTNGSWSSLGTMPEELRPSWDIYKCCYYRYVSSTSTYANIYCNTEGNIQQCTNTELPNAYIMYPIG